MGKQPLIKLATQEIPNDLLGATVGEMSETNQCWKWDLFDPYLPPSILKEIQSHELREDFTIGESCIGKIGTKANFQSNLPLAL